MKMLFSTLVGICLLAGCASTPSTTIAQEDRMSREKFVEVTKDKLEAWEERADDMSPSIAADLRASVQDTRAELRALQAATDANWMLHRDRVENNLAQIDVRFSNVAE